MSDKLETILDWFPEDQFVLADGFDEAIIGVDTDSMRLIYSVTKCIEILMNQDISQDQAVEYFEVYISNKDAGPKTPIWCYDTF